MKLTRRHLLIGSAASAVVAASAGGYAYSKRAMLRIPHGWVGYVEKPELPLYPSAVGVLDDKDKDTLWELMGGLGKIWDMDPGFKASFIRLVDLKTNAPPSYLAEYKSVITRFTELRKTMSEALAARTILTTNDAKDDVGAHARVHVAQEFVVRLLVSGGFSKFSLGKWPGYTGGPRGFRQSARPRTRTR